MFVRKLDRFVSETMNKWSEPALRFSFAVIFVWFGILKPLGMSAAAPLVLRTVSWMPVFEPSSWLSIIGIWEVLIGVLFLFRQTTRLAILLLFLQMVGTFMPLFLLPEVTFQKSGVPISPSMEGQYIIKNLMIISAALAIGGRVNAGPTR